MNSIILRNRSRHVSLILLKVLDFGRRTFNGNQSSFEFMYLLNLPKTMSSNPQ